MFYINSHACTKMATAKTVPVLGVGLRRHATSKLDAGFLQKLSVVVGQLEIELFSHRLAADDRHDIDGQFDLLLPQKLSQAVKLG